MWRLVPTAVQTSSQQVLVNHGHGCNHGCRTVHLKLRNYVQALANHCRSQGKELVVFIDTNPALSIYTQIALVAATHLIMPVNADNFSMQVSTGMDAASNHERGCRGHLRSGWHHCSHDWTNSIHCNSM
jgi:hypothetical protein